jgi:hypothetical protein
MMKMQWVLIDDIVILVIQSCIFDEENGRRRRRRRRRRKSSIVKKEPGRGHFGKERVSSSLTAMMYYTKYSKYFLSMLFIGAAINGESPSRVGTKLGQYRFMPPHEVVGSRVTQLK